MGEIDHKSLPEHIKECSGSCFSPVYLVFGEPYLRRKAVRELIDAMVPDRGEQERCVESVEHVDQAQIVELVEQLSTFGFFTGRQAVILRTTSLFGAPRNAENQVSRIRRLFEDNDMDRAADLFLRMLGRAHLALEDAGRKSFAEKFRLDPDRHKGLEWIDRLVSYCRDQEMEVPQVSDDASLIQEAVKRGFAGKRHLIITTDSADRRTGLYKTIKEEGTAVDCTVPMSTRKKDREAREQIVREHVREILGASGKKTAPRALEEIYELTGFDLHAITRGLEKLISYTGERTSIEVSDVRAVLTKSRESPIYELTGAVSDKNEVLAVKLLSELLGSGYHYLQILMALTNQVRRLILARGFLDGRLGGCWQHGMSFDRFKNIVVPKIQEYDNQMMEKAESWEQGRDSGQGGKKTAASELALAGRGGSFYPVYQLFLKAGNFSEHELQSAFRLLNRADVSLKTSGRKPEFVLQELIISICRGG